MFQENQSREVVEKPKMSPEDFFLYLGILITLYVSSVALVIFLFTIIDIAFPNRQDFYYDASGSIATSLSVFIIFYPIMIILLSIVRKKTIKNPLKVNLTVRKWFIYLTLFVTTLTIAIDLITLLNRFLNGEQLTIAFILKVITVIIVAGVIFWFSLKALRGSFVTNKVTFNLFRITTTIVVIIVIITGLFIMDSPLELRKKRDDNQRIVDLSSLQSEIVSFWQSKNALPNSLDELNDPLSYFSTPLDPETGESYGYRIISDKTFELCATFASDAEDLYSGKDKFMQQEGFDHGAGKTCFERTIDPDKFKSFPEPVIR